MSELNQDLERSKQEVQELEGTIQVMQETSQRNANIYEAQLSEMQQTHLALESKLKEAEEAVRQCNLTIKVKDKMLDDQMESLDKAKTLSKEKVSLILRQIANAEPGVG